uniref:Sterile alpha motif domain containing 4B n=1 Tax=Cyprinus carpio TaxID=7962 RepID=A0A8C1ZRM2_CYPCA
MMFRDQVGILTDWFKGWNECEQTVALLSLLKRVSRTQARFLHICLDHWLADCTEIHILEAEANNAAVVSQWQQEPKEKAVSLLLSHLPLLQPRNSEAKCEYMKLLQKVLSHTIESSLFVEESRQLLSYALIHPATTLDDRNSLALWLNHLEEHLSSRPPPLHHARQGSDEWPCSAEALEPAYGQNGHMSFPGSGGVTSPVSSSTDVPAWLKSLRLHKYASLFSQMTYEEMMILTEQHLESQNVTKGARHKIALSIQKLRERQSVLKSLEKDILEGGNVRNALQELQQIIITPIKVYAPPTAAQKEVEPGVTPPEKAANPGEEKESEGFQTHNPPACDGESPSAPIGDGDIAGQFTRVMGKVCTQLLVSRPDEENISCYLQLIEKCLTHEAFTETQKKRLLSWKQQVLKLLRLFPRKTQYGSNSLPTAGSVSAGLGRRGQRPFQMPPRGAPPAGRMGLMSAGGLTGASPRHSLANPPAVSAQGRQNLWFGNPGGSNSMPSQSRSSVQRTHSLPVHTSPQTMLLFQQQECQVPGTDLEINPTLESLCLSMTEHALGDGMDRTSTI